MGRQAQAIDNQHGALMRIGNKLAATLKRAEAAEAEVKRLKEKLAEAEAEHPTGVCLERIRKSERDRLRRDLDQKDHELAGLRAAKGE